MRLSVCLGCGAIFLFEKIDKVVGVFISCFQGDFVNFFLGGEQQVFCGFHPFFIEIFERRQAEGRGKFVADPVFAHMAEPLQITESYAACQVVVYVMSELPKIGSACRILPFQMEGVYEKFCQNGGYETGIPQFVFQGRAGAAGKKLF